MGGDDDNHSAVPVGLPVFKDRAHCYAQCLEEIQALVTRGDNFTSSMGNVASILFYNLNAFAGPDAKLHELIVNWCGFYLLARPTELLLGEFQGKVACQKIRVGKGVCGSSVLKQTHTAVSNVHDIPGHIACDAGSNSEIVILIRSGGVPTGRIVGLLDIDSTQVGFFSDADIAPLEAICNHLGKALAGKFPIETAAAATAATTMQTAHPGAATVAPAAAVMNATRPAVGSSVPTTVVHVPRAGSSHAPAPKTTVVEVQRWEFQSVQHDVMLASQQFPELEARLGVKMLPEVVFADNLLNFICPLQSAEDGRRIGITRFSVKALDALESTAKAYRGLQPLALPASASWDKFRGEMHSMDPNIDWAFRNDYSGRFEFVAADAPDPKPLSFADADPSNPAHRVDYELLKRQDLPIHFFASLVLYEDDLHDSGESNFTVKARVMDPCFFVLLRHHLRIDGMLVLVREVRVFHLFGTHTIVVEEVVKEFKLDDYMALHPTADREGVRRAMAREADCAELLSTLSSRSRVVTLPTSD